MQSKQETKSIVDSEYRDPDSERILLAYTLKNPNTLDETLFALASHKAIVRAINKHRAVLTKPVVRVEVKKLVKDDKFEPFGVAIDRVFDTDVSKLVPRTIDAIVGTLIELKHKRERLIIADRYVKAIVEDEPKEAQAALHELVRVGGDDNKLKSGELLADFEERVEIIRERQKTAGMPGIPTGIVKFDQLSRGILKQEFGIVIGESSMGKSMFLENFGLSAWDAGYNVFFGSIEMGKHEVEFRADARLAKIKLHKFRTGEFDETDYKSWAAEIKKLRLARKNYFHVEKLPRQCSAEDIEEAIYRSQDRYRKKVDLVVIDYLNIMGKESKKSNKEWTAQADAAWGLKSIATELNESEGVALWSANQITDEGYGQGKLDLTNVKYGRAISEVCSIVLALTQDDRDKMLQQMKVDTLKFRGLLKPAPIIVRPNFDLAMINREADELKTLSQWRGR